MQLIDLCEDNTLLQILKSILMLLEELELIDSKVTMLSLIGRLVTKTQHAPLID